MILCLDVGNSQIYGGVFKGEELIFRFRHNTTSNASSDQFGLFLRDVLRENEIDPKMISNISLCTVVPHLLHTLRAACVKYFNKSPYELGPGVKTGLQIKYRNPSEVGADRIANAISGTHFYPGKNLVIVDFGTATTFCAVTAKKEYLGGIIMPGMRLMMESLEARTAKLPSVEIVKASTLVGRTTVESIQSGLYYGHAYAVKGIIDQMTREHFKENPPVVIGTGGFATLLQNENIFHSIEPHLVLQGLFLALKFNS